MNDELNGLTPDMIYIDEAADVSDYTAVLMAKMAIEMDKNIWHTITTGRISSRPCSMCHVSNYEHGNEGEEQHPFFNNNLEYLEWEAARRV